MLRDVEDFARRRPWIVAGIGLAAGLAASRFLKASSERRYDVGVGAVGTSSRDMANGTQPAAGVYADEPDSAPTAAVRAR